MYNLCFLAYYIDDKEEDESIKMAKKIQDSKSDRESKNYLRDMQ